MDRIVVEMVAGVPGKERRRCVKCGYSDDHYSGSSPEPRTRLTASNTDSEDADNEKTPIRILDPGKFGNSD